MAGNISKATFRPSSDAIQCTIFQPRGVLILYGSTLSCPNSSCHPFTDPPLIGCFDQHICIVTLHFHSCQLSRSPCLGQVPRTCPYCGLVILLPYSSTLPHLHTLLATHSIQHRGNLPPISQNQTQTYQTEIVPSTQLLVQRQWFYQPYMVSKLFLRHGVRTDTQPQASLQSSPQAQTTVLLSHLVQASHRHGPVRRTIVTLPISTYRLLHSVSHVPQASVNLSNSVSRELGLEHIMPLQGKFRT